MVYDKSSELLFREMAKWILSLSKLYLPCLMFQVLSQDVTVQVPCQITVTLFLFAAVNFRVFVVEDSFAAIYFCESMKQ